MRTPPEALLTRIRLGEDAFLELKEATHRGSKITGPTQDMLADELAAFANAAGGELVLGVRDRDRSIVGIPLPLLDAVEQRVRDACEQSVRPALAPIIERISLAEGEGTPLHVLRVAVPRSLFIHQSPAGYLHRVGSSKRPIPPDYLGRLFQQRSQSRLIRFDETPVPRAELTDLAEHLLRRFLPPGSELEPRTVVLSKLAMVAPDEAQQLRPTVAGLLMASPDPSVHLPGAFIQAVAYRGTKVVPDGNPLYQLDAADLRGPLDVQIRAATAFVRRNMRVGARKDPEGGRIDLPNFDLLSVFEAVTNAVAHRDYSIHGAKVRLRLFRDRLELFSPGMLPNTMTPESLAYRQSARNEALTSLLARCPVDAEGEPAQHRKTIMDKRGEGVPVILRRSEALSGRRPVYRMIDDSELLLTLFAAGVSAEEE